MIDTTFDMYSDSNGKDPDSASPTLQNYHKLLWSKTLPNGKLFELEANTQKSYLWHSSSLGEFSLGSDAITHSYKNQKRKRWLTSQIPNDVDELFAMGSTIGGYLIFPNKQIDRKNTINQARGVNRLIDDRLDLTLECIKRFYSDQVSPLTTTLDRYKDFFRLFGDFSGYTRFFFLEDLVDKNGDIKFYLPFDSFRSPPEFRDKEDYLLYKHKVIRFITRRNQRISYYSEKAGMPSLPTSSK